MTRLLLVTMLAMTGGMASATYVTVLFYDSAFNPWSGCSEDGNVVMYSTGDSRYNCSRITLSKDIEQAYNLRPSRFKVPRGQSTSTDTIGFGTGGTGTLASNAANATDPVTITSTSGGSTGNDSYLQTNTTPFRVGRNNRSQFWFALSSTANIRSWLGFTNVSGGLQLAHDSPITTFPNQPYAAFRYSTDASDTNWQCITSDNSAQGVSDSGIAADTSGHYFEVRENTTAASWTFYIDNVLVCTRSANLPPSGKNLDMLMGVETRTGSSKAFTWGWMYADGDR